MKSSLGKFAFFVVWFCGVTFVLFLLFHSWAYDDPFITYRYADNLRQGSGFVYNPDERVLSTTTPLFTILLAVFGNFWSDLPRLANLLGVVALAWGGLFIWDIAQTWKTSEVGWVGLLLYPTFPLLLTTLGSEMPLYVAFCLGTFAFYIRQKYHLSALCGALAVLTRYDGLLVILLLVVDYILRVRRAIPWTAVGLFLGITLPWFLFAGWYFGSFLPVTLMAKQQQGTMFISQRFAPGFLTILQWYVPRWQYQVEGLLAIAGIFFATFSARLWLLYLTWPVVYFLAYTLLGVTRYFWYYAPLVPGFLVAVGLGVANVRRLSNFRSVKLFVATAVLVLALGQVSELWQLRSRTDRRVEIYRAVGHWLNANTLPGSTVGTLEVGIIGYYARRPMIDFAGLLQPEVAMQFKSQTTFEDAALWAVERYKPNYLVLHDGHWLRLEQEYTTRHCSLVQRFLGETYGYSANLSIYACRWS